MAHIPAYQYADYAFYIAVEIWMKRLTLLWSLMAYFVSTLWSVYIMVKILSLPLCSTQLFGNMETAVSMEFYEARLVQIRKRSYTILPNFADPSEPDLFLDVKIPFGVEKDA